MKYGKLLLQAQWLSNPGWADSWMDYASLKRLVGVIAEETGGPEASKGKKPNKSETMGPPLFDPKRSVTPKRISNMLCERAFFIELKKNLDRVCSFYDEQEKVLVTRAKQLSQSVDAAEKMAPERIAKKRPLPLSHLVDSLKVLYVDLMMLENYAVMNYGGFAKILKKHDKNTPFTTQEKYLRKVVNPQAFALYFSLKECIKLVESCFEKVIALNEQMNGPIKTINNPRSRLNTEDRVRLEHLASLGAASSTEHQALTHQNEPSPAANVVENTSAEPTDCEEYRQPPSPKRQKT
jgi:SPX domain protein involved in polyphosphate accumulation